MLRIVTPPGSYPVTLDEAKAQLRVSDSSNDVVINALIPAATKFCQSLVQKVFVFQTMEWVLPAWREHFREHLDIPIAPVVASDIISVKYVDWVTQAQQTLDPSLYVCQTRHGPSVRIAPAFGTLFPLVFARSPEPVVIRFEAGYEDPATLPDNVKPAILLMLRHLYTLGEQSLMLTNDTVFGLGSQQFGIPQNLETLIPDAVRNLMLDEAW